MRVHPEDGGVFDIVCTMPHWICHQYKNLAEKVAIYCDAQMQHQMRLRLRWYSKFYKRRMKAVLEEDAYLTQLED